MEIPDRVRNSILGTGLAISGGGFNHCISGVMESVISLGLLSNMLKESRPRYHVLEDLLTLHTVKIIFSLSKSRSSLKRYVTCLGLSCQRLR